MPEIEGRMAPFGEGLDPNQDILYSRVCFNISSSSRVKFSSTDTARISWYASASLDDINLSTTCLRYSKLISLESLRSEVLVTVVLEVGGSAWMQVGGPDKPSLVFLFGFLEPSPSLQLLAQTLASVPSAESSLVLPVSAAAA